MHRGKDVHWIPGLDHAGIATQVRCHSIRMQRLPLGIWLDYCGLLCNKLSRRFSGVDGGRAKTGSREGHYKTRNRKRGRSLVLSLRIYLHY